VTPEGSHHTIGIDLVAEALRRVFGPGFYIRIQHPLACDDHSEPESDVAVVTGAMRDYRDAHRTSAVLVVEVASEPCTTGRSSSPCSRAAGFGSTGSSPSPRSSAIRPKTATAESAGNSPADSVVPVAWPDVRIVVDDLLP